MKLSDHYLLVTLSNRQPRVTAKSEKARQAAIKDMVSRGVPAAIAEKTAKSHIELWPDKEIRDIMSPFHSFRTYHDRVTVPYVTARGPRLLSIKKQQAHSDKFFAHKLQFEQAYKAFEPRFAAILEKLAVDMGEYFDPSNYPTPDSLRNHFQFDVKYLPIADPSAFELGAFTEAQAKELENKLTQEVKRAAEAATREYRDRLREACDTLAVKLRGGKGTRLHDSLLTNLRELLDAGLNVSGDQKLDATIADSTQVTDKVERAMTTRQDVDRNMAASEVERLSRKLKVLF